MSRRPKTNDGGGQAPIITTKTSSPILARGQCPKCLTKYGRAMPAHVQVCTGNPQWPGVGPKPSVMIENGQPVVKAAA